MSKHNARVTLAQVEEFVLEVEGYIGRRRWNPSWKTGCGAVPSSASWVALGRQ